MQPGSIDMINPPHHSPQGPRRALSLRRSSAVLPDVAVALRRAKIGSAVHPAPLLALHRRGLALRSLPIPPRAARGFGQLVRLQGIVRVFFALSSRPPFRRCIPEVRQ